MVSILIIAGLLSARADEPQAPAPAPAPAPGPDDEEIAAGGGEPEVDPEPAAEPEVEAEPEPAAPSLQAEPLPEAPARVDPGTLEGAAWRGKGFFQIHIAAMVPVAGVRPGAGTVASAGGGLQVGWRPHRVVALGAAVTTFLHDHDETGAVDSAGEPVQVRDFGRITLFEPAFVRVFIPTRRKVEPRFDAGVLVGSYRPPFGDAARVAAGARVGVGVDVWIGPAFSLDFGVDPRLIVIDGAPGLTLQAGMGATVHW